MCESDLEEMTKMELIIKLVSVLINIVTLLEREVGIAEGLVELVWREICGPESEDVLELIMKVIEISDHFTKLIKSGKHKFKKEEVLKLTPITKISNDFTILIKSEENILEKGEEIAGLIEPLFNSIVMSEIGHDLKDYEEREENRCEEREETQELIEPLIKHLTPPEVGVEMEGCEEREESGCEKREEMRVGDIMISKSPIKRVGVEKYHEVFEIDGQYGVMFFVTKLKCVRKHPRHGAPKDGRKGHVKYDVKSNKNGYSCREHKDVLYENYEKFDKDKTYEL